MEEFIGKKYKVNVGGILNLDRKLMGKMLVLEKEGFYNKPIKKLVLDNKSKGYCFISTKEVGVVYEIIDVL